MRRRVWILAIGLAAALAAWFAVKAVETWQFHTELRRAQRDLSARRFGAARVRLARLAQRWPGQGEVEYSLGDLRVMARGHAEAAMAAWGRVPDRATRGSHRGAITRPGRHRRRAATGSPRPASTAHSAWGATPPTKRDALLAHLHWITGRHDEYRSFLRRELDHTRDPAETLRLLWSLDHEPHPIEGMRRDTGEGGEDGPRRRPRLARAGRPGDPFRTARRGRRFAHAVRAGAAPATPRSGAPGSNGPRPPAEPDELDASGQTPARFRLSQETVAGAESPGWPRGAAIAGPSARPSKSSSPLHPDEAGGLERLADLAAQDGEHRATRRAQTPQGGERRGARSLRVDWSTRSTRRSTAAELARAADALGRSFDARAWWTLAARRDRSRPGRGRSRAGSPGNGRAGGPSPVAGRSPTSSGRCLPRGESKDRGRRRRERPHLHRRRRATAGLAFTFDNGRSDLRQLPETMSGGVAVLDFDGDGWLDVYAVQGGPFPPPNGAPRPFGDRLFRNRGDGRFEDATAAAGLSALPGGYGHGVAVGDYDNDGRPDLFVTRWRSYALYHNRGNGSLRGRHGECGARRRPRLADLGGVGRPGQRRRRRSLCVPLPAMGPGNRGPLPSRG